MNPILPQSYDYLWAIAALVMLTPIATTVFAVLIYREVRKIRRNGETKG